jgi:hypothetical protein
MDVERCPAARGHAATPVLSFDMAQLSVTSTGVTFTRGTAMSRGLGRMQHRLLVSLKPAKRAWADGKFDYIGDAGTDNLFSDREGEDKVVFQGGKQWRLDDGVYDLRATLRYLTIALNKPTKAEHRPFPFSHKHTIANENEDRPANQASYWRVDDVFRISFYRAARNLVDRGLLISCDDDDATQLRFVSMHPDIEHQYAEDDDPLEAR